MILLYLILFAINLVLWLLILKVGTESDEQMKIIMENHNRGDL